MAIDKEELFKLIQNNSSYDGEILRLGNLLEIKPVYSHNMDGNNCLEGYDIYKYASPQEMEDEDYDFDADFICTVYVNE